MAVVDNQFYITGGTLPVDATSYVERQADTDLLAGLLAGEYCYVLNTRQMGKSSLMVRTAVRLRDAGVTVAILDLTAIGQNLSPEQWYDGLLLSLASQLDLEDELEEFWSENPRLGPMQRFFDAIERVALPNLTPNPSPSQGEGSTKSSLLTKKGVGAGRLVIFVDEIDAVRSLPFPADEFFAGIRECYNRRVQDDAIKRLTFCLLGVATPADLITETRISPFNIGQRILVTDFTPKEARPLAQGVQGGEAVLGRVLYWTSGHPYMTQRLCRAIAEEPVLVTPSAVDGLCDRLFLSKQAREIDDNLAFVRNRLLRSEADLSSLMDLYQKIRTGRHIRDDETNPLCGILKLSGAVKDDGGLLKVRNRIYNQVFDRAWIQAHMPDAELQRQRAAYRKGLMRAVAVSSVIIVALGALSIIAIRSERRAQREQVKANDERNRANGAKIRELDERTQAQARLYAVDMSVAQQALERGDLAQARYLLERNDPILSMQRAVDDDTSVRNFQRPPRYEEIDRRGFEWRYLWRLSRGNETATLNGHARSVKAVIFSRDGKLLISGSEDKTIKLWDMAARRVNATRNAGDQVLSLAQSSDGKTVAAGCRSGAIQLWGPGLRRLNASIQSNDTVLSVAISPSGRILASGHLSGRLRFWNIESRKALANIDGQQGQVNSISFSPDGQTLASGGNEGQIRLWAVASRRTTRLLPMQREVLSIAFSPDGKVLAAGGVDGTVVLWIAASGRRVFSLRGHRGLVNSVAFAPDGKTLATGGSDYFIKLWDVSTGTELSSLRGHTGAVYTVAFSPDGKTLASGSGPDAEKLPNYSVKIWNVAAKREIPLLMGHIGKILATALSQTGKLLASGGDDGTIRLWNTASGKEVTTFNAGDRVLSMAFSPSGNLLVFGSFRGNIKFWDLSARRLIHEHHLDDQVVSIAFTPDGRSCAFGCRNGKVSLWNTVTKQEEWHFRAHERDLTAISFYPDNNIHSAYNKTFATSSMDGFVKIWNIQDRSLRESLPISLPQHVAYAPDGSYLAASSADGFVVLWRLSSGSPGSPYFLPVPSPHSVAFSPDGRTLAIGSLDTTMSLWNVATRQEMLILKGHSAAVSDLVFSVPDGSLLATASWDSTLRLWPAPLPMANSRH